MEANLAAATQRPFADIRASNSRAEVHRSAGRMVLQASEDIGEPGVRIDVVDPGGVDQRIDRGSAAATFIRACEGPVVATDSNWPDLPLGGIVGHAQPPIVEEARQRRPSGQAIGAGFADVALSGELCALLAQPGLERNHKRTTAFIAHTKSLLCGQAIDLALDGKQLVDAFDGLDRDRRLGEADEIKEVVPRMRPARDLGDRTGLAGSAIEPG